MDNFDWNLVAAAVFGLFILFVLGRVLLQPLRFFIRVIFQLACGGLLIFIFNLVGGQLGITVGLNPASICLVGFLGLPGLGFLVALRYLSGI